jgi:hypothetical protein
MYLKVVDKVRLVLNLLLQCHFILLSSFCLVVNNPKYLQPCVFMPIFSKNNSPQVNQQYVSAFLTAGNIQFVLLHAGRSEENIKNFFYEVHELYVKVRIIIMKSQ